MSYCRFLEADAYIYEHVSGWIECCGCSLEDPEAGEDFGFFRAKTAGEMLAHIEKHREAGDSIPQYTDERIKVDHPDLDKEIEPWVEPPEVAERRKARMKELFGNE